MAKKWQKLTSMTKQISLQRGNEILHILTAAATRFVFPIVYLSNHIFRELFKMSEEEFGLPRDGPIMLPCDAVFMNYVVFLIKRRVTKDMEKALLVSMATSQCSRCHSLCQEESSQHVLLCGF
ncbi:hypothetical protein PVL29_002922 [Vitis rotundifolia]|uniref:Uncharacterized protein n=1 Tax=Vitis rotundifolia TaxID=103349 RepID=A0AA39E296_VITRO|nr:hypothetical protein PVL29_002922 [Vitis rotundifolia]